MEFIDCKLMLDTAKNHCEASVTGLLKILKLNCQGLWCLRCLKLPESQGKFIQWHL